MGDSYQPQFFGVVLAGALGWSLAYPTARLRTDYFAIVTISLGEIVRVLLAGEPLLRVGSVLVCHRHLIVSSAIRELVVLRF